jgi:hypothetical protein
MFCTERLPESSARWEIKKALSVTSATGGFLGLRTTVIAARNRKDSLIVSVHKPISLTYTIPEGVAAQSWG